MQGLYLDIKLQKYRNADLNDGRVTKERLPFSIAIVIETCLHLF